MLTLDFETQAIQDRPNYPPDPVGVALKNGDAAARYFAWGHAVVDPRARNEAHRILVGALQNGDAVLMHNASFDLSVLVERCGLGLPQKIHDTMILAFLLDPYGDLGLKELATTHLKMPPVEQDAVRDWLIEHKIVRKTMTRGWGAHIAEAPADVVGPYAVGDLVRTEALFNLMLPKVQALKMLPAYEREMDLLPMLLDNEQRGIPIARVRLKQDEHRFSKRLEHVDVQIRRSLKSSKLDIDSNRELAQAISRRYKIDLPLTEKGNQRTSKDVLADLPIPDGMKALLLYRSALAHSVRHYLRPWLAQGSVVHVHWQQVRGQDDTGSRTGRLSSSPNFQNLTVGDKRRDLLAKLIKLAPKEDWILPEIRSYIEAPPGWTLFGRDYSQQELRLLAHFEDGELMSAYRADPDLDIHTYVQGLVKERSGLDLDRKIVKTVVFARIYGAGVPKLMSLLGLSDEQVWEIRRAFDRALPGVGDLQRSCAERGRAKKTGRGKIIPPAGIRTLGGRRYLAPPNTMIKNVVHTYEYRLMNYLIQGSAADQTKEAMRQWWSHLDGLHNQVRFLLTVHDELVGMARTEDVERESAVLDKCMVEAFQEQIDVPVKTDAEYGKNWGAMK